MCNAHILSAFELAADDDDDDDKNASHHHVKYY